MASQKPIVVGGTYDLGGVVLLKVTVTHQGIPVTEIDPQVTIIRDSDKTAANFSTGNFVPFSTATIVTAPYSASMTEVAFGTYFYEFDPADFDSPDENTYTVIFHYSTFPYEFVLSNEFTFTGVFGAKASGFGILNRETNVCLNTPFKIAYQSVSGLKQVRLTIYNPYGGAVITDVPMIELNSTGVYEYTAQLALEGDHIIYVRDQTNDAKDSMIISVGGSCDKIKRIDQMLRQLTRNPPTVYPCGSDPCS